MKLLEERISKDGVVIGDDILKVDMFLNHQVDVELMEEMGKEFARLFAGCGVTRVLTIEVSGIPMAMMAAKYLRVPMVFAKKGDARNISDNVYAADVFSFTKGVHYKVRVDKNYLHAGDRVLIIDDFLANGQAIDGLMEIVRQAQAETVGVGIAIEKGFQPGGRLLREYGVNLHALAIVDSMQDGCIVFRKPCFTD